MVLRLTAATILVSLSIVGQDVPRRSGSLFYDETLGRLVLLNGIVPPENPEFGQIWAWDGRTWSRLPAEGPSMRTVYGAAYDTRRKRIVMFGGTGRLGLEDKRDDTWEWDGRVWHRFPDTSVGTRDHHAMAYDEDRGRTVLYGGMTSESLPDGTRVPAKDTWEWDGHRWTRIAAAGAMPPGGGAMAYDATRKHVVLFGGLDGGRRSAETWAWDGRSWRRLAETGPSGRNGHTMVFDRRASVILLFGGTPGGGVQYGDFWQWDGQRWTEITAAGPSPGKRASAGLAYDSSRRTIVLFGGHVREDGQTRDLTDMWEWDGRQWKEIRPATITLISRFNLIARAFIARVPVAFAHGKASSGDRVGGDRVRRRRHHAARGEDRAAARRLARDRGAAERDLDR